MHTQRILVTGGAGYIGALGSMRMQQNRADWLAYRGITNLSRVHGPAGIDINAHTPAEVAVSIAAQIVAERAREAGVTIAAVCGRIDPVAARALGLSRIQALRHVVVPQAFRRVIPPLLNDFIGLQKDTALVSILGVVDTFRQAQILKSANFNFTPLMTTALIFLVITIPMTRLVDRLAARDRAAQQGGAR